jgi:hypothetical protein
MARNLYVSPKALQNRLERLARQAIALHSITVAQAQLSDEVCIDGFVSFDISQFTPSEIPIALTAHSQFILDFSHALRRRSGCMTTTQKKTAAHLYTTIKLERGALTRSFREVLHSVLRYLSPQDDRPLVIITDEKPEYRRVIEHLSVSHYAGGNARIAHQRISGKCPRTVHNPLFASNYLEREIRKDLAAHHRESVCYNRNVANGMLRMALYLLHHNYVKPFRIGKHGHPATHAEAAGVKERGWPGFMKELTAGRRRFLSELCISESMQRTWLKRWVTPTKAQPESLARYVCD